MHNSCSWGVLACLFLVLFSLGSVSCGSNAEPTPTPTATPTPGPPLRDLAANTHVTVGAAAAPSHLGETLYAATLAREYQLLEPENAMKFGIIHPQASTYDYSGADQLVTFAQAHTMQVRGHCFVWHQQVPSWLSTGASNGTYDAAAMSTILQDHINAVSAHFGTEVVAWDVVNEAFSDDGDGSLRSTLWYNQPGIGFANQGTKYIEQAFQWARAANPSAKLFYNDYGFETGGAKSDAIYAMAQDFKNRGIPLDGIGFQMHVGLWFNNSTTLANFAGTLQRFTNLGLEVQITELDVALDNASHDTDLVDQGQLYAAVANACLDNPHCTLLQTWGFTDRYSWIPQFSNGSQGWALPLDSDYNQKPAYTDMYNMFLEYQP